MFRACLTRSLRSVRTCGIKNVRCCVPVNSMWFHSQRPAESKKTRKEKSFSVDRSELMNDHMFMKKEEEILQGKEEPTPLARDLLTLIRMRGPISLHDFIAQTSNNAIHGYYQSSNEKIGEQGDFITAPELSQLFGEIIGVWVQLVWRSMGSPSKVNLIEMGPGKGTLMADILKVNRKYDNFKNAVSVHFVELSRDLRLKQLRKLVGEDKFPDVTRVKDMESHDVGDGIKATWYSLLHQVPSDAPCIIIGQEFLDAFPVHQFVYTERGWREKLVDVNDSNDSDRIFRFVLAPSVTPAVQALVKGVRPEPVPSSSTLVGIGKPTPLDLNKPSEVKVGDGLEISPLTLSTCEDVSKRVLSTRGAAIMIDYGEDFTQEDSLRGFQNHKQLHVLSQPGKVDLTADVDFKRCRLSAESKGAFVHPLLTQGQFLMNMGIVQRVEQLINREDVGEEEATALFESMKTLVLPDAMGSKFKVMIMSHPEIKSDIPGVDSTASGGNSAREIAD